MTDRDEMKLLEALERIADTLGDIEQHLDALTELTDCIYAGDIGSKLIVGGCIYTE